MNYSNWQYQNIALAAAGQCALLVRRLANTGAADDNTVLSSVQPLLVLNPANVAEIYPSVHELMPGLVVIQEIFANEKMQQNGEVVRYLLGMLALQKKLMSNNTMQLNLRKQLEKILTQSGDEDSSNPVPHSDAIYQQLASVYQSTISSFSFRIHVKGSAEMLRDELVANKIRSLLLAGIRSAVLWHQLGGRRWRLIIYRKRVRSTISDIRRNLLTHV